MYTLVGAGACSEVQCGWCVGGLLEWSWFRSVPIFVRIGRVDGGLSRASIALGEIGYIPTHTVPSGHRCVGAAGLSSGEDTPMGEISGACDFCAGRWRGACARPGRVLSSV